MTGRAQITYCTVLGKTSGSLFHQSTAITSILGNRGAPSGFRLTLVPKETLHSAIGNWRLHYNVSSRPYTYITVLHQITSNVRRRESSARNRTRPWCPKPLGLRQAIKKENRTYRRSLHQVITAAESRGCQDGCPAAAPGWGQWLIRRPSFLTAEGV
jgi:hypothetical protein